MANIRDAITDYISKVYNDGFIMGELGIGIDEHVSIDTSVDQTIQLISQSLKPLTDEEMLKFIDRDKDRCNASECCAISRATIEKIRKELLDGS